MKYIIEGGFDFYHALNVDEIEKVNETQEQEDDTNKCLITRMPLTANFVEMQCGHKFNYLPLYNDLCQHMKPTIHGIRKNGYIVCPFCRQAQQTFLPFNPTVKSVVGVNLYPLKLCLDTTATVIIPDTQCEFASTYKCDATHTYKLACGKHYCESHKILGMSIAKQDANHADFLLKKEKQKQRAEKKLAIEKKKQEKNTMPATDGCMQLIKSGPRKDQICGCKKIVDGTCFRHKPK